MHVLRASAIAVALMGTLAFAPVQSIAADPAYEVNPPMSAQTQMKISEGRWTGDPSSGDLDFQANCKDHRPSSFFAGILKGYSCVLE